jgi:hypothetical protein
MTEDEAKKYWELVQKDETEATEYIKKIRDRDLKERDNYESKRSN